MWKKHIFSEELCGFTVNFCFTWPRQDDPVHFNFSPTGWLVPSDCYSGRLSPHLHRGDLPATPRCENMVFCFCKALLIHIHHRRGEPKEKFKLQEVQGGLPNYTSAISGVGGNKYKKKSVEDSGAFCHKQTSVLYLEENAANGWNS